MITFFIREIREKKGLSQDELAKLSGISASHIGYIENGERQPTLLVMCKLADALKVSIDELYEYHK
ncbi:MAG: helix-turn-helix transcriptional regulator [Clostridia bacterium]|jgi:putative transcriptional regulator|nr:helix-turn-helix transcriptional regulator [Clostridia bacterium]